MIDHDSAAALYETVARKAPEYLDLLTARSEEEFDVALIPLLEKAVTQLEANKANFAKLDEEGLSSALAMGLTIPGVAAIREGHSNGHVDLTITGDHCVPARRRLAEAKIYDGPVYHIAGLKQLLCRYMTGREGAGILVVYFRKKDIAGLVKKIRAHMDVELPLQQQGATTDHALRWCFCSVHAHTSGENIGVSHIACNLYVEGAASAAEE